MDKGDWFFIIFLLFGLIFGVIGFGCQLFVVQFIGYLCMVCGIMLPIGELISMNMTDKVEEKEVIANECRNEKESSNGK